MSAALTVIDHEQWTSLGNLLARKAGALVTLVVVGLIVQFILLTIISFMYFFLDTSIMYFGVSDSPADCFDFPLGTLFIVIFTGLAIGVLITRFLVFPLIKKNDIP